MKKEIIIISLIIIVIAVSDILLQNFTQNFFDEMSDELGALKEMMEDSKTKEEVNNEMNKIQNKWNKYYNRFACYIEHDEIEKVQTQLISIKANIETDNYDRSIDEVEKCKFIIWHICEKDTFKLVNIL